MTCLGHPVPPLPPPPPVIRGVMGPISGWGIAPVAQWALHLHGVNRQGAPIRCGAHVPPAPGQSWAPLAREKAPDSYSCSFSLELFSPWVSGADRSRSRLWVCGSRPPCACVWLCPCRAAIVSLGCFHSLQRRSSRPAGLDA